MRAGGLRPRLRSHREIIGVQGRRALVVGQRRHPLFVLRWNRHVTSSSVAAEPPARRLVTVIGPRPSGRLDEGRTRSAWPSQQAYHGVI